MPLFFYVLTGVSAFGAIIGALYAESGLVASSWAAAGIVSAALWIAVGRALFLLNEVCNLLVQLNNKR